jgi:hypothetical protein
VTTAFSTEERLEQVDREVVELQRGVVDALSELVDGSFQRRWSGISERLRGLRSGLQAQDFDKQQIADLASILLDIRDGIDAINEAGARHDLEAFDRLLVLLERMRHIVRDAIDEHVTGAQRDVGLLMADIDRWLPHTSRQALAELAGVDRRTLARWSKRTGLPSRRMQIVAQLIAILRHSWTEEGVVAWFHRPRRDLDGRTPLAILSMANFDEDKLFSAARAGRSQYAA